MQTLGIEADINVVDQRHDDLTERQCDDCQIVTAQFQYRNTDQPAHDSSHQGTGGDAYDKPQQSADSRSFQQSGNNDSRKGANAHKAGLAKIQFTGNTDVQIQTDGGDGIRRYRHQQRREQTAQVAGCHHGLQQDICRDDDQIADRPRTQFRIP